ncbi:hypothetical protein AwErysi_06080 [Erysipelotrichaceae bacterium]|nr:hypothetical protein AwErysi_06080 [Erysipelotrichaceae bacterium]
MKYNKIQILALPFLLLGLIISGCATTGVNDNRIVINYSDGSVAVVATKTLESIQEFDTDMSAITAGPDGRHIFMSNRDEGIIKVLDTGLNLNAKNSEPAIYDYSFTGEKPAHIVSNQGKTALFFDGSGVVDLIDAKTLTSSNPQPIQTLNVIAHHGVAVPRTLGGMISSTPPAEGVVGHGLITVDATNTQKTIDAIIPKLHGEASATVKGDEYFAFGGEKLVYLYNDTKAIGSYLSLPDANTDADVRVSSFASSHDSAYIIGNYASKSNPNLAKKIVVIDVANQSLKTIDLGTTYLSSFGHNGDNIASVIGTDGNLYIINLANAEIMQTISAMAPWTTGENKNTPRIAHTDKELIVSDPTNNTLVAIDTKTYELRESTPFAKPIRFITAV